MIYRTVSDQRTGRVWGSECEAMTVLVELTEALDDQRAGKQVHVESNIERVGVFSGTWCYTTTITNQRYMVTYRFEE